MQGPGEAGQVSMQRLRPGVLRDLLASDAKARRTPQGGYRRAAIGFQTPPLFCKTGEPRTPSLSHLVLKRISVAGTDRVYASSAYRTRSLLLFTKHLAAMALSRDCTLLGLFLEILCWDAAKAGLARAG